MKIKSLILTQISSASVAFAAALTVSFAMTFAPSAGATAPMTSALEAEDAELDPFAPNIEETLKSFDAEYESQTGQSAHLESEVEPPASGCYRQTCHVWALVERRNQVLYLYIDGNHAGSWLVSTGMDGHETPDFDRHPNGRIYDRYTSTKFPEGDYMGLGNMPYAVFIEGGFALHGTTRGSWPKLGHRASHGCVRQHPDNAHYFNRLVRSSGIQNVWVTVR